MPRTTPKKLTVVAHELSVECKQDGPWLFCLEHAQYGRVHLRRELVRTRRFGVQVQSVVMPCNCVHGVSGFALRPVEERLVNEFFSRGPTVDPIM